MLLEHDCGLGRARGVANSQGPMHGVDLRALARYVAGVIAALADEPAMALGHAFGNFVALVMSVEHGDAVRGAILAAAAATKVADDINAAPFVAGDHARPEVERLAALRLAFFAPGRDPRAWLNGWQPATLAMQRGAVKATDVQPHWYGGRAPMLEINARHDPFKPPPLWSELRDPVGERVTTLLIENASHALFPEAARSHRRRRGGMARPNLSRATASLQKIVDDAYLVPMGRANAVLLDGGRKLC